MAIAIACADERHIELTKLIDGDVELLSENDLDRVGVVAAGLGKDVANHCTSASGPAVPTSRSPTRGVITPENDFWREFATDIPSKD